MPKPEERLVLAYLGEAHYHRMWEQDAERPACTPKRMRGVASMRVRAELYGQSPCPICWPEVTPTQG